MNREKQIILAARIMSLIFTPFYLPFVGLVALFLFSYLSIFPWAYKLQVLVMVYLFTILLPTVLIHLYRRYQGWNLIELGHRERRMVPYVISILCYFTCIYVMDRLHMPHFRSHRRGRIIGTDCLCPHQRMVENLHTYRSNRRCSGCSVCFCRIFRI